MNPLTHLGIPVYTSNTMRKSILAKIEASARLHSDPNLYLVLTESGKKRKLTRQEIIIRKAQLEQKILDNLVKGMEND